MGETVSQRQCAGCDLLLLSRHAWRSLSDAERDRMEADGYWYHGGKGLCARCYIQDRKFQPFPDMSARDLEFVPDDQVHPEHLKVRNRLRYFRKPMLRTAPC